MRGQLFLLRSWDGQNTEWGPDRWSWVVRGGPTLVDATFSTYTLQSYPGTLTDTFPAQTGSVEQGTLGYFWPGYGDLSSVYDLEYVVDHSGPSLNLDFTGGGLGPLDDESWGLDNLQVDVLNQP